MRSLICRLILACTLAAAPAAGLAQQTARVPLYGYADATGRMVAEPIYPQVSLFFGGDWVAISSGRKGGFLNLRTGESTGLIFDGVSFDLLDWPLFQHGPEPIRQDGKSGYADQTGRIVVPPQYEEAGRFGADGLAVVRIGGRPGFIDRAGRLVVPGRFDRIGPFFHGFAAVERSGKWGAIDRNGVLVVPTRFTFVGRFAGNGLAVASLDGVFAVKDGHYGFIDAGGRFRIPPIYTSATAFDEPVREGDRQAPPGLARVTIQAGGGLQRTLYVDSSGRTITAFPAGLSGWHVGLNGLIQVQDSKTAKWGAADASGRLVIPATFDSFGGFGPNGLAAALVGGKWGYVRADGRFAIAPTFDTAWMFDAAGRAQVLQGKESLLIDEQGRTLATFPQGQAVSLQPSGYTAVRTLPPQIDYPVRRFGRWTLERIVYAVPDIGNMGPESTGRVRLSMLSEDGLVSWTAETHGWVLNVETEVNPGSGDRTDLEALDVMPVGAIGLLDIFRRHLDGEVSSRLEFQSADPAARAEQASRMRTHAERREAYRLELDRARDDLERAWAAMGADVRDQFGTLSGRPCMPPECPH